MRRCFSRAVVRICRQWTGGKTGVPVAAALLAALWLLPALQPALASPPRAAQYEAYPAIGWQTVDSAEAERLSQVVHLAMPSPRLDTANLSPKLRKLGIPKPLLYFRRVTHPGLSHYLPGVEFLRLSRSTGATGGPDIRAVAVFGGRLYALQSFNRLLVDCGFKFDTSEIPSVAKIAVLWTLMDIQARLHEEDRYSSPDSAALATAIPAVTFKSVGRTRRLPGANPFLPYAVDCLVNGQPVTYRVEFGKGYVVDLFQGLDSTIPLVNFLHPGLFKRQSSRPATGTLLAEGDSWTILVGGDVWTENQVVYGCTLTHYFLRTAENGDTTGHDFVVSLQNGPDSAKAYLLLRNMQDRAASFWDSIPLQGGSGQWTWTPRESATAEYVLSAWNKPDTFVGDELSSIVILDPEAWRTGVLSPGNESSLRGDPMS